MKIFLSLLLIWAFSFNLFADLKYHPIKFELSTEKEYYYEGEKITFFITITNTDKEKTHPVLIPHTQNVGQKLFYLNLYDKANNTFLLRATEDKMLNMMVHDTGTVKIVYLKPLEKMVIPIYLNDFENYYSYHTQNSSHHSFGVPLFAGIYKVNVTYNPYGIALGDSIYNYYHHTETDLPNNGKLPMWSTGDLSHPMNLKIRRSNDTIVSIEKDTFYIKTDGYYYYYMSEYVPTITTDLRCIHISNLPADSCSVPKSEYFYSHFTNLYAEYMSRFDDGDILEYRKFTDYCPDYLYTERYNEQKQKVLYQCQLPDKRFYSVTYLQPQNSIEEESYCIPNGTKCTVTTYKYDKQGILIKKKQTETEPCVEFLLDGKIRSGKRVTVL
ncbi:MAG TPA: hypothetical protein PKG88_04005 [Bacteroidales bacterium]|nr:hypothetical protein [Bacteroidales bacterium]HPS71606.1 hypothetical protein [Bacteroidales bacterium]